MGLVNLRKAKLLLLSLSGENLKQLETASAEAGYRGTVTAASVPAAISALKGGKFDIVVADSDLGGTPFADFVKALKAAFPKVRLLPVSADGALTFPVDSDSLGKAVDKLMMEKMGITASGVALSEDF